MTEGMIYPETPHDSHRPYGPKGAYATQAAGIMVSWKRQGQTQGFNTLTEKGEGGTQTAQEVIDEDLQVIRQIWEIGNMAR